jgi:Dolichyl-phosphate-mannose-protein mannosyltransferase
MFPPRLSHGRMAFGRKLSRHGLPVLVLGSLSLAMALIGGTPFYHPDFITGKARHAVLNFGNPDFFHYPALGLYLNGALYGAYEIVLRTLPSAWSSALKIWPYSDMPGHLLTASFSVMGALSTYGTGYLLTRSREYGFLGGLLLITSPLWNAGAHFLTVDIPLAALCALTLYVSVRFAETTRDIGRPHALVLGILVGLAASVKYNGAIIVSSAAAVLGLRTRPFLHSVRWFALCGISALVTFALLNPFILIDSPAFVRDFMLEMNHAATGHPGYTADPFHYHLSTSLYYGWGWMLALLSGWGTVLILIDRRLNPTTAWAVLLFPILHLSLLLGSKLAFQRYALPLIPFVAVLASYGVFGIRRHGNNHLAPLPRRIMGAVSLAMLAAALAVHGIQSVNHNLLLQRTDTRAVFRKAFSANKSGLRSLQIAAGRYSGDHLGVPVDVFPGHGSSQTLRDLDILIMDSFSHDRYIYDKRLTLFVDFSRFTEGLVVTLTPYDQKKDRVPFSPESLYSPYFPDSAFRLRPGPYIEVYFSDASLARSFSDSLSLSGVGNASGPVTLGYYYNKFSRTTPR